jgi:hypothetical protein
MSLWPNTTDLVIGAETDTSTYPSSPNATLQESDFAYVQLLLRLFSGTNMPFKRTYNPKD